MSLEAQARHLPNGAIVLSLKGDATGESRKVEQELRAVTAQTAPVIVIDLREMAAMDARGRVALESVITQKQRQRRFLVMTPRSGEVHESLHRMHGLRDARSCILI